MTDLGPLGPHRRAPRPPDRRHVRDRLAVGPILDREDLRDGGRGHPGSLSLGFGLGKYPNRNVMDAYGGRVAGH